MKKLIYKINQYLLENYPIIWNTKLVWVLSSTLILHILFFIFGFLAITNPKILHEYGAKSIFFENGTIFISIILSTLILVTWLIFLFKNNAFKSFYPTSRVKLFKQFLIYLIITFFSTTFYISYNFGVKSYISSKYDDERIEKEIIISNSASLFFSEKITDYTINQRRYPHPFNTLYCETISKGIHTDNDSLFLSFLDFKYRFYTLYKKKGTLDQGFKDSTYKGFVYHKTQDSVRTYFYKDSLFDISSFVQTNSPSYFNYSKIFYQSSDDKLAYDVIEYNYTNQLYEYEYEYDNYSYQQDFNENQELWNKQGYDLLKRNNSDEIKQILADFLMVSDTYEIRHNLTADEWFKMVYHPNDNFELKHLIRTAPKETIQFADTEPKTAIDTFYKNHITDYYLDNNALHYVFDNIKEIKASNPLQESIHFFIWFSFFFSSLIFMFRVTGLKALLFTVISSGILTVFVTLLTVLFSYITKFNDNNSGYFVSYLTLILGAIILSIPIFYSKKLKKLVVAICLNMSISGFILYVFLIITIISLHQSDACVGNYSFDFNNKDCFNLMGSLGVNWSYVLFIINLLFIYFYSGVIKNWKALPEG
ncbi:hypothetical protein Q4Q35_07895 [Flavivirga aquimarina]|uniref:Uncharacterized protein n=1 Tax=Flavivirga aquimarina TaxID=2027862 RepID=A0ABT8W9I7_9FLAO|nr:hypothetical protein [Flavivirga aquimarina]MDO5969727.1 hypothetical protein [Flavivirga aquimarina]